MSSSTKIKHANRDPITGEPGSHPFGTTVGAVTGIAAGVAGAAAAGAGIGSATGPVGTVAGAVIGGIVGGLAGSSIAEDINPTTEDAYWRENYTNRDYIATGSTYDIYQPAYRYGVDAYVRHQGRSFDEIEPALRQEWNTARGTSELEWDEARNATRDAYERLYNPDDDGR